MKTSRQEIILEIIADKDIETQNQLMLALHEQGVKSTQATLSRDIKEMRLVKELAPSGRYRYASSARDESAGRDERLRKIFRESVVSCETAQNLIVIKTLPGLAMAASSALDGMNISGLVGTVAGDDTAFLAMCDTKTAEALCANIKELF
ncbi:MAG: arginine repressor [Clostridia bacterium]|nr:arginine repressor [Clostridia bacterium]